VRLFIPDLFNFGKWLKITDTISKTVHSKDVFRQTAREVIYGVSNDAIFDNFFATCEVTQLLQAFSYAMINRRPTVH